MALDLTYKLLDAGWALVTIRDGNSEFKFWVSYLNDSLAELAESAVMIRDGLELAKVVFMDEPGEAHLIISRGDDELRYELRWYGDWCSWGFQLEDSFKLLHEGRVPEWEFLASIRRQLQSILREHGEAGYLKSWIEHPFPINSYNNLLEKSKAEQAAP